MKNITTLILSLAMAATTFAQKVDYDTDSKWFLGFNVGGTWNTTDVQNKTNAGWGFIFGRQFNYNYGNVFSYDLRFRYLGGRWYGQDYDTSDLTNFSQTYMPSALNAYKNNPGYTVRNFNTNVHEAGLELAIHLNRLRENTGWDPYIFGGVNIAWNQTYSDLVNIDSSFFVDGQYDYTQSINEAYIDGILDGDYETPMNLGTETDDWNTDFVPSLGFGIGYQVAPKVSIGLEHKTSFALKNDWDGVEADALKWNKYPNDLYHYTSGYIRFHFGKGKTNVNGGGGTGGGTNNLTGTGCVNPVISFIRPNANGTMVDQQVYAVQAKISNVATRNNIVFRVNGVETTSFVYNETTDIFEASVSLNNGANSIQITSSNACGTDTETMNINYSSCLAPVISMSVPAQNNLQVTDNQLTMKGVIINNPQDVQVMVNGVATNAFYYNNSNGTFQANIALQDGMNTIQVVATNACGSDSEVFQVNFGACESPDVQMLFGNNVTVNSPQFTVKATLLNVANQNNIAFRVNGSNTNYNYVSSTGMLQKVITLQPGANIIQVIGTNECGTDTESFTVNYVPCNEPVITMISPVSSSTTASAQTMTVKAKVENVANVNSIQLIVNGTVINGLNYNAATKIVEKTVGLQEGTNSIQLTATNDCGIDRENLSVGYNAPCLAPMANIFAGILNNGTTEDPYFNFQATVLNVVSVNQLSATLNGSAINGLSLTGNNLAQQTVLLQEGANTIVLTATNECGTDVETFTVNYDPCDLPTINLMNPSGNAVTVDNATFALQASIGGVSNGSQITLTVNGSTVSGASYNASSDLYRKSITLQEGTNIVQITVTNDCGTVTETVTINYDSCDVPVITMIQPASGTTLNSSTVVKAKVTNVNSVAQISLTLNGTIVNGGTYNAATKMYTHTLSLLEGENLIKVLASNACGSDIEVIKLIRERVADEPEMITICHRPPGNPDNTQELQIPLSAWPAHQAHGDVLGPCPTEPVVEEKITICHIPPGNSGNPQEIEIPLSAWPAHQAHGDVIGPCVTEPTGSTPPPVDEEKITICHHPPGNPDNTQEIQIPLSAWPAHEAHGDTQGSCPEVPVVEETITICHKPPGNPDNTQELEIPLSAWPAHQAHGDNLGPCVVDSVLEEKITICHIPPGNSGNPQEIEIPLSAWPAHQAHGDNLGPCSGDDSPGNSGGNGNGNGNSGGNGGNDSGSTGGSDPEPTTGSSSTTTGTASGIGGGVVGGATGQSGGTSTSSGSSSGGNTSGSSDPEPTTGSSSTSTSGAIGIGGGVVGGASGQSGDSTGGGERMSGSSFNNDNTKAELEAKRIAEEAAAAKKKAAEEAAKKQAEIEAQQKAEKEAKAKAEAEAKKRAEELAKKKAAEEAKLKAEQAAKRKAEEQAKAEAAAKKKAEEQAKLKAEQEAKRKAEEAAKKQAELDAKQKAEAAAKAKAEQEAKKKAEEAAKAKAKEEAIKKAEGEAKKRGEKAKEESEEEGEGGK